MSQEKLLRLVKHVVNAVQHAMPIGAFNYEATPTTLSSQERTGGWSYMLGMAANYGGGVQIGYKRVGKNKWEQNIQLDESLRLPPTEENYTNPEVFKVNLAVYAELNKAGNCGFMASLALIYLCQFAQKHLMGVPFSFKFINGNIDHALIQVNCYGFSAICDPWLSIASLIEPCGSAFKELQIGLASQGEDVNDTSSSWTELKQHFTSTKISEKCYLVDNHDQVNKLLELHKKRYQLFLDQRSPMKKKATDKVVSAVEIAKCNLNVEIQKKSTSLRLK